jgi:hypothetical protein
MESNDANAGADHQDLHALVGMGKGTGPPQTSSKQVEAQAGVEAASDDGAQQTADSSMFDKIKECIPQGSGSILEDLIYKRSQHAQYEFISSGSPPSDLLEQTPEAIWAYVDSAESSQDSVLFINDIDDGWCEALCARFPKAINQKFLLTHILAIITTPRRIPYPFGVYDDSEANEAYHRYRSVDLKGLHRMFPCLEDDSQEICGRYVDCWLEPSQDSPIRHRTYMQANRFVSYCHLKENLCKSMPACGKLPSFLRFWLLE